MRITDILTWGAVTVGPDDPLGRAVEIMLGERVSGVPVVDEAGQLVGILTEGDLLRRAELGTEQKRSRWLELLVSPGRLADEYSHARSRKVADVMTRDVVTVSLGSTLAEAVDLMTRKRIKRIPVVEGGRIVGILSRADVLKALGRTMRNEARHVSRPDPEILAAVQAEIGRLPFNTESIQPQVSDGEVVLTGTVSDERERTAIRVAAENVPGVCLVRDNLTWIDPIPIAGPF